MSMTAEQTADIVARLRQLRHNTRTESQTLFVAISQVADSLERGFDRVRVMARLEAMATWEIASPIAEDLRTLARKLRADPANAAE